VGKAKDSTQAVELSQVQWRELALSLAAQCQSFIKKRETIPGQLLTQAAIAYDKAFAKADPTDIAVSVPRSLELAIVKALTADKKDYVNSPPQVLDPASVPGPCTEKDTVTGRGQGQGHEAALILPMPGVGLRSAAVTGAGAAYPPLSPVSGPESENISEKQKDPLLVHAVAIDGQGNVSDVATAPVRVLGPKRFKDPFAGQP
jgi:hypothetical protein